MLQKRSEAMLVFEGVEMSGAEPKEKLLYSLLQVSFLRAEGKLDEADEVLASTQKQKHLLPSKFYHQKGLQEIIRMRITCAKSENEQIS